MRARMWKSVILLAFLIVPTSVYAFSNSALDRELKNALLTSDDRSELKFLRKSCSINKNLKRLTLPKNHRDKSEQFDYWYEYIPALTPTEKTVLFVPGGPGGTSIGSSFVPANFNAIQIDLRGVGCNFGTAKEFPGETMKTLQAAIDVLRVIEREGLKQYIIHGHSYGTVLVTQLGALLTERRIPQPAGVILEGTFGSAFESWADYLQPSAELIDRELALDVRNRLALLVGKDRKLGSFVGYLLSSSFDDDSTIEFEKLQNKIRGIRAAKDFVQQFPEEFENWRSSLKANPLHSSPIDYVLETIECKELTRSYNLEEFGLFFIDGHVQVAKRGRGHERCLGLQHLGYRSENHQITAPLYYFQGERDVSTSLKSARQHFESQRSSEFKAFFQLRGRGHNPLQINLNSCLDRIYLNIFNKDISSLRDTFSDSGSCKP